MRRTRLAALFLAVMLLLGTAAAPASAYEVRHSAAARTLWASGLFLGDGVSFALDQPLRRVEGIVMMVRLLGKEKEAGEKRCESPFTDVPAWAADCVGYAYHEGLITGTDETTLTPNREMSAKEFLVLTLRTLGYDDRKGDFPFDEAAAKALELGLITEEEQSRYTGTEPFLRDDLVQICSTALTTKVKGTSLPLRAAIATPGRPAGSVPANTAKDAARHSGGSSSEPGGRQGSGYAGPELPSVTLCHVCEGTGMGLCAICGGKGEVEKLVTTYDPDTYAEYTRMEDVPCGYCSGGWVTCTACNGEGIQG